MEEEKKNLSNEVDLLVNNKDVCFQKLDRNQWNTIEKRVKIIKINPFKYL